MDDKEKHKKDNNALRQKARGKKAWITKVLKEQGKYTKEMSYQVEITARLLTHVDMLWDEVTADDFNPVTVEKSREGYDREHVSAKERLFLEMLRYAQRSLASLGMNTDSKQKVEGGSDSFDTFIEEFKK